MPMNFLTASAMFINVVLWLLNLVFTPFRWVWNNTVFIYAQLPQVNTVLTAFLVWLDSVEWALATALTPYVWIGLSKRILLVISVVSGAGVFACLLTIKSLHTLPRVLATVLGGALYLLSTTAFHQYCSRRTKKLIKNPTIFWFLKSIGNLSGSVSIGYLSDYVETKFHWNGFGVAFNFCFYIYVISIFRIYRKDDILGVAEAILDVSISLLLKYSRTKNSKWQHPVVLITSFLVLLFKNSPPRPDVSARNDAV